MYVFIINRRGSLSRGAALIWLPVDRLVPRLETRGPSAPARENSALVSIRLLIRIYTDMCCVTVMKILIHRSIVYLLLLFFPHFRFSSFA